MELTAAIEALSALKRPCVGRASHRFRISAATASPSGSTAGSGTAGRPRDSKPVKNADLWQALDALIAHAQGRLALGARPCRPRSERARRRARAQGHGAVPEAQGSAAAVATRRPVGARLELLQDLRGRADGGLARRVLHRDRRHHAVLDDHGEALGAHAHAARRAVEVEARPSARTRRCRRRRSGCGPWRRSPPPRRAAHACRWWRAR